MGKADKLLPACEQLLMAQKLFAAGEIPLAVQSSLLALAYPEHECAAHALLGEIYTAAGDVTKAQMHFHAALAINIRPAEIIASNTKPTQQHRSLPGIMMLVLISCILLSGIAALFGLQPARHQLNEGDIFQIDNAKVYPIDSPRWAWQVPALIENNDTPATSVENPPSGALGPAGHEQLPASKINTTLKSAHEAYDRGDYQRALAIYEQLESHDEIVSPLLQQDIAFCHQQLGNSAQAQIYLHHALEGYRQLLLEDSDNIETQQGIASCESALKQLRFTREP